MVLANAFGLTTALLWVICSAFIWLLPKFSLNLMQMWMHGMEVTIMGNWNLTAGNFLWGGLTLTASLWFTGWVFGWAWEKTSQK